jgi:1,4-alpha-glucan branching enzyme
MYCLALVLELHHPLPGPADAVGFDWAGAALDGYWPLLEAVSSFAEEQTGGSVTLAISPSWMALASDPTARGAVLTELHRRAAENRGDPGLARLILDRWDGDAIALIRHLGESGAVYLIPMTSSHAWLPSVAQDPVVARAQVRLAAADHAGRLARRSAGIWLPFLGYLPGLESIMGEAGIRFFGVGGAEFLRGTILPPAQLEEPMVTPAGVAVFGVNPATSAQVVHPDTGYGRDTRYLDPTQAVQAAADHADHFLRSWQGTFRNERIDQESATGPISVVAVAAHDLGRAWPLGKGGKWLQQVLLGMAKLTGFDAVSLSSYLERRPTGIVGRPGPSAGGFLAARPGGSDVYDRCRAASELLTFALEHRRGLGPLERRAVAHMTRSLLRAQQVDWSLPPGHGVDAETGLKRASAHLQKFYVLAGLLLAGRLDRDLLAELDRGPAYLPEIDLELLTGV